jgi:hypothetical protein
VADVADQPAGRLVPVVPKFSAKKLVAMPNVLTIMEIGLDVAVADETQISEEGVITQVILSPLVSTPLV